MFGNCCSSVKDLFVSVYFPFKGKQNNCIWVVSRSMFRCKIEYQHSQVCVTVFNLPFTSFCLWWTFLLLPKMWKRHSNVCDQNSLFSFVALSLETFLKPSDRLLMFSDRPLTPVTWKSSKSHLNIFQCLTWIESLRRERDEYVLWLLALSNLLTTLTFLLFKGMETSFSLVFDEKIL